MQIRFCPECGYQNRDDDFEINHARRNMNVFWDEETKCPKCKSWLWSVIFERDFVEITDWDENSIHGVKDDLKSVLMKSVDIIHRHGNSCNPR